MLTDDTLAAKVQLEAPASHRLRCFVAPAFAKDAVSICSLKEGQRKHPRFQFSNGMITVNRSQREV